MWTGIHKYGDERIHVHLLSKSDKFVTKITKTELLLIQTQFLQPVAQGPEADTQ